MDHKSKKTEANPVDTLLAGSLPRLIGGKGLGCETRRIRPLVGSQSLPHRAPGTSFQDAD